ncbi:MAG: hypothetical protein M1834_000472 [Cirrosporium novae-zelandiae]|nr:MAG: hypothetical protein M1834_000472 [Cirrosporium novae-zelandiae]
MDAPRGTFIIVLLLFIILSPNTQQPTVSQQNEFIHLIEEEKYALQVLNTSRYGDFDPSHNRWLNISGLQENDTYAWDILPRVKRKATEQLQGLLGNPGLKKLEGKIAVDGTQLEHMENPGSLKANSSHTLDGTHDHIPLYRNVSGIIRGEWLRSKGFEDIRSPSLNLSNIAPDIIFAIHEYDRNITGAGGKLRINFDEKEHTSQIISTEEGSVREIHAILIIQDETSNGDGWEMTMHGVHFPEFGEIILTTSSEKTIKRQESSGSFAYPWSSSPNNPSDIFFPVPHCEFVVYLQQHPMSFVGGNNAYLEESSDTLQMIEDELQYPLGAPIPSPLPMTMSAVIFSPDCGFVLETKGPPEYAPTEGSHLVGPKVEVYIKLTRRAVLAFSGILSAQLYLLMRQMKDASTPSTKSRISFYSIAIMSMGDGFACLTFLVTGLFFDSMSLAFMATSFVAFFCVSFLGMKFLMDIWTVQAPERDPRPNRNNTRTNTNSNRDNEIPETNTSTTTDSLPAPVTATRLAETGAALTVPPPGQNIDATIAQDQTATQTMPQNALGTARREFTTMYARFYLLLIGIIFLSLWAGSWPTALRSIYTNVLAFIYLSFWVPQIYRNIIRNCRKALRWEFVMGQSCLRLSPILYFYLIPGNILLIESDANAALALVGWLWIQICILYSHEIIGPRFFIPFGWAPPAYDYHPILREEDEESGVLMPIGFTQATANLSDSESTEDGTTRDHTFDCAICMQDIEVPILSKSSSSDATASLASHLLSRRSYMVTPCRHIFHTPCLEGWMKFRLQCPVCRETLPPL